MGKGVCGTAAAKAETQLVEDVHQFAGHIACDAASNSEIVIPLYRHGELIAVLDIDSPSLSRFDKEDQPGWRPGAESGKVLIWLIPVQSATIGGRFKARAAYNRRPL